ncbi:MAG: ABC transporter ATP-binding protein [bacterium]
MADVIVDIAGLNKTFGELSAVRDVSLSVERGEIFGLLGPDGAGKTTMMRMLAGIMPPTSGNMLITGKKVDEVKTTIGYMPQRFSLYGDLTVEENLLFTASLYGIPDADRISAENELLEFSRLAPFRKRLARNLSGGMKQKLALSCTLIHTPQLLLLDEPTTGVDPISRRELWKILYSLPAKGVTIIISTPYMDEAERCNRIAFINKGEIVRVGTPDELKNDAGNYLLEIEVDNARRISPQIAVLPGILDVQIFGDKLHVSSLDIDNAEKAVRNITGEKAIINRIPPTLEDAFIRLAK